jgi:signal transduction histidine kinase
MAGFGEVDLSELLRTVVEVYQPMAEENGQDLSAEIACGLKTFGDPELLAQMFANVLENALRHSPEHAVVRLHARCDRKDIMVEVSDSGPGIPAEEHANVFRRFYRLETSRTTPGNGLGLSLVGAIADLHDIAVRFDNNRPGLKVTVTVQPAASRTGSPSRKPRPFGEKRSGCERSDVERNTGTDESNAQKRSQNESDFACRLPARRVG